MHIHPPKPLHGWREFAGEVGIIVLGILIALGCEQLVELGHWRHEVEQATEALHSAVAFNALAAIEQQVVAPCIDRQLTQLEARLFAKGPYRPAPLYNDRSFIPFTIRAPSRKWVDGTWRIVTGEGVATHLSPRMRERMDNIYESLSINHDYARQADQITARLNSLSLPLTTDSATVAAFARDIEELRAKESLMTLVSGQVLGDVEEAGMMPAVDQVRDIVYARSGTIAFCRSHHLPMNRVHPIHVGAPTKPA